MRLLNVYTFEFVEFFGDSIPPYKITSHRWSNDEATLKDVQKKRNVESKGYKKVQGFCKFICDDNERLQAHFTNDLSACEWIWIDTACIDKKSTAEVSESINSMFGWYSRALECIAYLADVPSLSAGPETVMSALRQSEWFTRGWTLQELLVPRFVVFLNQDWEVVGHKCAHCGYENPCRDAGDLLNNVLAEITGIAEDVMFDYEMSIPLGVDEKMSWMTNGTTTKTEDMAYCMMGVFDVNMPLLYGEGFKALGRLEREIANQAHDAPLTSTMTTAMRSRISRTEDFTKQRLENVARWTVRPSIGTMNAPMFSCQVTECASAGVSFKHRADLDRHVELGHGKRNFQLFDCELLTCHRRGDYGFTRKDKMREHMILAHRTLFYPQIGPIAPPPFPKAVQPRDPGHR